MAGNPQAADLLCPRNVAGLTVLITDALVTSARAVLYTSLWLDQEAAFALRTTLILPPSFWWPTTHMPTLSDLRWCTLLVSWLRGYNRRVGDLCKLHVWRRVHCER